MKNYKIILLVVLLLGLIGMAGFSYYVYGVFFDPNFKTESETEAIYITTDADFKEVYQELKPFLIDGESFVQTAKRKGYINNIKPGKFVIKDGLNNNQLINVLRSQNVPVKVVFNNQERLENLAGRIAVQIEPDSTALMRAFTDEAFLSSRNVTRDQALGLFLPLTYESYWNTTAEAIRDKMITAYDNFWNDERRQKAEQLGLSPIQVSALASIVQKETIKKDEQPRVAGVYLNRIERGMKLDADPTVIYAKKRKEDNYNQVIRRVLNKDLLIDSPYNTYKYAGVPPGPIVLPDISSIQAVLNPESHNYKYFVADPARPGYHKFAKTYAQHLRNAARYRQWINEQGINR